MNEQLQKALAEIISLLTESAKTVGTAAQQEIPVLVQEYLAWGFWSSMVLVMASLAGIVALWAVTRWVLQWSKAKDDAQRKGWSERKRDDYSYYDRCYSNRDYEDAASSVFFARLAGTVVLSLFLLRNLYCALQVAVAPRVYLLETVIEAIK